MSLAYALFGAPRYPTGEASDGSADNAIRFGGQSIGIDVVDGWAHLHELAKAASSERKDFAGLTPAALHNIIESDVSGRWWLSGGRVCKVPRADRYPVSLSTTKEESMSVSWVSFG